MQITLNQAEIVAAVEAYVCSQITVAEGQKIDIDFTAGRGNNGLSATLSIGLVGNDDDAPAKAPAPKPVLKSVVEAPEQEEEEDETDEADEANKEEAAKPVEASSIFSKKA